MKKLLIPIVLIGLVVLSGCDLLEFDEDINRNPNLPSKASSPQLIANAMLSLPDLSSSPQGEFMAQYLAETQYVDASLYPEGGTSFYWLYQDPLINLQTAIDNAQTANQSAVARILKAYFFWHITDRWGDIPYSEALDGFNNFTPVYEPQQIVYDSLFTLLKDAGEELEISGTLGNDLVYNGDMEKWRKFSNTVRLLMALRLSEVDDEWAEQEFNDALNDGIMTSNEDNLVFHHLADANNQNYWYGQVVDPPIREWWALTEGLVGLMNPVDDPRLSVYGNEARDGGGYEGLLFGEIDNIGTEQFSLLGSDIYAQDAPVYLVTYAQALFAKAEAAERGWIAEDPVTNYNSAIEHSIRQWTGSSDGVSDFLNQPEVAYDPANGIEQIATQRYVHLFMHGYEAWAEWRRTGYPDIMENPGGRDVPLRQSYASGEALNNTENYNEAVKRQFGKGNNNLYGRLWWDVE